MASGDKSTTETIITDAEASDIVAGALFRELLDVVTASTETADVTIAQGRAAVLPVLDAARDSLGPERGQRVCREALGLVLAGLRRGGPAVA